MLPGVKTRSSHIMRLIRQGLMSIIDSGPILHFHYRSFEDFLLSSSFLQVLPNISGFQDQNLHERQFASMCLNCMISSEPHFNMCNLESSNIKNVNIPATSKSAIFPLILYSSLFWEDHLVHTQHDGVLMKAVEFAVYNKLLFQIEAMSILGKAHGVSACWGINRHRDPVEASGIFH